MSIKNDAKIKNPLIVAIREQLGCQIRYVRK